MTTHIMAITYPPKIPSVKSGNCDQTIRIHNSERPKRVGDKLLLHTWAGLPYRSKWDWRLETEISEVLTLFGQYEWFGPEENRCHMTIWKLLTDYEILQTGSKIPNYRMLTTEEVEKIIERDGIKPVKYEQLEMTLESLNGLYSTDFEWWDVIRWKMK